MSQLPLPTAKLEYSDGTDWHKLASESWVLNTLRLVPPCLVSTTANLTATYNNGTAGAAATLTNSAALSALVLDGIALAVGNRVLVKNQSTAPQNGIYAVTNIGSASTNWVLTRVSDYDSPIQIVRGDVISVISGTSSPASLWMLTTNISAIGTDSFVFVKTDQNSFTSILGTTNQINVSINAGVVTLSIADNPILPGTGSVTIPSGTLIQRDAVGLGKIRITTNV